MSTSERQASVIYFRIIVVLFPFLVLLLLEVSLRAFGYGENLALFIPASPSSAGKEYLRINPQVAERYFPKGHFIPRPTSDRFLNEKPRGSYRIFALGGSTIAGWPYPNNVMFTRLLQRRLTETFPEKQIEVINLGMAAINSFTLLDFIDEVLEQQPDAILIYAGHNEFYSALGAASTVSLGATASLIRLYLSLQRFKAFLLLRDAINRATLLVQRSASSPEHGAKFPTLMGQVIGEDQISLGSDTYERGKAQFRGNLRALLSKTKAAGVPVITSELVSNVRDHPPFFSNRSELPSPAEEAFRNARSLESRGLMESALAEYTRAKDLDGLRFRATEEFNAIIHELAEEHGIPVVPMKSYFEAASPNRLVGNTLMLEHLHPNARGHQLMSRAFFDTMQKHRFLSDVWDLKRKDAGRFDGFSELDVAIGEIRILHVTDHWPFKPEAEFSHAVDRYAPRTKAEELAKEFFLKKISFRGAHMKMAEYYASRGVEDLALREYWALVNSAPLYVENYLRVSELLIEAGSLQQALPFIEASLQIGSSQPATAQLLMKLTYAYLQNNQVTEARRIFARLQELEPKQPGIERLVQRLKRKETRVRLPRWQLIYAM
ncbi:MAG: GDSL-type esterase/lipase family protein [Deltaproteobacteria bacterium]|nr:GDSL-type esterase/lipase family protein [Deltaproteobacteria bacterium]